MFKTVSEIILQESEKLNQIEEATLILNNQHSSIYKDSIHEHLLQASSDVSFMSQGIKSLRSNLEDLKAENERCREMLHLLETLNNKLKLMEQNIPSGIRDYMKLQETIEVPKVHTYDDSDENISLLSKDTIFFTSTPHSSIKDCKKLLFKEHEVCPLITPLTQEEFAKIPKYIIGRQSLDTINNLIACINQILKAKYTLLSLGKNGAKKKGDLDLYLQYKKQQTSVREYKEKIYFFTADDYQKYTSRKLDKIKLNILTALRSCKKLKEIRMGKLLYYMVVTTN